MYHNKPVPLAPIVAVKVGAVSPWLRTTGVVTVATAGTNDPVVTVEPAFQLEVAPANAKFVNVPLGPVMAVKVVTVLLFPASLPWLKL